MAGWLRELRIHGWLATIEHGSIPQYRPMARAAVTGNRAAVYALQLPLTHNTARNTQTSRNEPTGDKIWTPTHSPTPDRSCWVGGSSRARATFHNQTVQHTVECESAALRAATEEHNSLDFTSRVPA